MKNEDECVWCKPIKRMIIVDENRIDELLNNNGGNNKTRVLLRYKMMEKNITRNDR